MLLPPFQVTRNGFPIQSLHLKKGVNPNIRWALLYEEWDSCVESGLDLWDWACNVYPVWFKNRVVALCRTQKYVRAHSEEAAYAKG